MLLGSACLFLGTRKKKNPKSSDHWHKYCQPDSPCLCLELKQEKNPVEHLMVGMEESGTEQMVRLW